MPFLPPNQQRQSTEGIQAITNDMKINTKTRIKVKGQGISLE